MCKGPASRGMMVDRACLPTPIPSASADVLKSARCSTRNSAEKRATVSTPVVRLFRGNVTRAGAVKLTRDRSEGVSVWNVFRG